MVHCIPENCVACIVVAPQIKFRFKLRVEQSDTINTIIDEVQQYFEKISLLNLCLLAADYVTKHEKLSEDEARDKFRQIVFAIQYCHEKNVVHRDLKVCSFTFSIDFFLKCAVLGRKHSTG